ncbi:MAG: hypothetical protein U9Q68_09575 [Euryarchaeota archaeon]|nr:hypothetical protein [Euryarchaeota archaeon]
MIILPVDVAYRGHVKSTDAKDSVEFMRAFDQSTGIIASTNEFRKDMMDGRAVLHSNLLPFCWFCNLIRLTCADCITAQRFAMKHLETENR